uniref:Uncharacterized protein n=1 Tax=Spongospora subterranea TaxID=70186 RepID=A0A0H5R9Z9_9EUKA|eukprot:CRZ10502.1 hypothetical protein [Spongospora subterranea]
MEVISGFHPIKVPKKKRRNTSLQILNRSYRAVMVTGMEFSKFKYGRSQRRILWCDPMLEKLYWGVSEDVKLPTGRFNIAKAKGSIDMTSIFSIIVDRKMNQSDCALFNLRFQVSQDTCLSVITTERTLDLEADSPVRCQLFVQNMVKMVTCPSFLRRREIILQQLWAISHLVTVHSSWWGKKMTISMRKRTIQPHSSSPTLTPSMPLNSMEKFTINGDFRKRCNRRLR